MKSITQAAVTFLFLIAMGSQSALLSQDLYPRISYKIRVDAADLSGFDVEMRVRGAGDTVRIAMASHPEYDDRYWRYVQNLTAESRGVSLQVTSEESALWRVFAAARHTNTGRLEAISLTDRWTHRRFALAHVCCWGGVFSRARDTRPSQQLGKRIRTRAHHRSKNVFCFIC